MTVATVITGGYGTFAGVTFVPTFGYLLDTTPNTVMETVSVSDSYSSTQITIASLTEIATATDSFVSQSTQAGTVNQTGSGDDKRREYLEWKKEKKRKEALKRLARRADTEAQEQAADKPKIELAEPQPKKPSPPTITEQLSPIILPLIPLSVPEQVAAPEPVIPEDPIVFIPADKFIDPAMHAFAKESLGEVPDMLPSLSEVSPTPRKSQDEAIAMWLLLAA